MLKWLLGRIGLQGIDTSKTFWEVFNTGKGATVQKVLGNLFVVRMDLAGVQRMHRPFNYTDSVKSLCKQTLYILIKFQELRTQIQTQEIAFILYNKLCHTHLVL